METTDRWTSIPGATTDVEMRVFIATPSGRERPPGLVLIHEAFGIDQWVQDITRRFASEGFITAAPDLFSVDPFGRTVKPEEVMELFALRGRVPPERRRDPGALNEVLSTLPAERADRLRQVMQWSGNRDMGALAAHVDRAVQWLRSNDWCGDKVGLLGFCFGGGMTLRSLVEGVAVDAAAPFYGSNPPLDRISAVSCPLLLMYGRNDPFIMPQVPDLVRAVQDADLQYGLHVFEQAGHAFLNDQRPDMYSESASAEAWPITINFFQRHLAA